MNPNVTDPGGGASRPAAIVPGSSSPSGVQTVPGARKHAADLPSDTFGTACPVVRNVPAMLAEDPLFHELCDAFDELLAPMESALDCFAAYLDPSTAPPDFVDWLGELVGAEAEPGWPIQQRRKHLATAVDANRLRGTAEGLRRAAAAAAGVPIECVTVEDPGGVTYSTRPVSGSGSAFASVPASAASTSTSTSASASASASAGAPVVTIRVLLPKEQPTPGRRRARSYGEQDVAGDPNASTTVISTVTATATRAATAGPSRRDIAAELVREAVERARPVHCTVRIELGES